MIDDLDQRLASRLRSLRQRQNWSLADLAEAAGVSKAMLSRIERAEASPTATILSRIASAFGITLAELLTFEEGGADRLVPHGVQPEWRDPASHYLRRQVLADPRIALELVEVTMPPGQEASFPTTSYVGRQHVIWVLTGSLTVIEGATEWLLEGGDRLLLGEPQPVTYANRSAKPCRYLVCVLRR